MSFFVSRRFTVSRAFTFVEVLVVLVILGVLAVLAVPEVLEARRESSGKAETENLRIIQSAKLAWMKDNPGQELPADVSAAKAALTVYIPYGWPESPWGVEYQGISDLNSPVSSPANGDPRYEPRGSTPGDMAHNGYNDLGLNKNIYLVAPNVTGTMVTWTGGPPVTGTPTPTPTPAPVPWTLSLSVAPSGSGTTTGSGTYGENVAASFSASPADATWRFVGWEQDLAGKAQSDSIIGPPNRVGVARMERITRDLTVNVSPSGSGTTSPSGTSTYVLNSLASVEATPNTNWQFTGFSGDTTTGSTSGGLLSGLVMSQNRTITANFQRIPFTLTMTSNPVGAGSVSPAGTNTYDSGTNVGFSASPNAGYRFSSFTTPDSVGMQGVTVSSSAVTGGAGSVLIDRNRALVANFTPIYTMNVTVRPVGGGTPVGHNVTYSPGQTASFGVTPAAGWAVSQWSGDFTWNKTTGVGDGTAHSLVMDGNKSVIVDMESTAVSTDLDVYKSAYASGSQPWLVSTPITYSIGVYNNSYEDALSSALVDAIPAGMTVDPGSIYVTSGSASLSGDGRTLNWNLGTLYGYDYYELYYTATGPSPGSYVNTATASTTTPESDYSNNSASATVELRNGSADLGITKTSTNRTRSTTPWLVGDTIRYTLTVANSGLDQVSSFSVVDTLPSGATLVPGSVYTYSGTFTYSNGVLNWDGGSIYSGGTAYIRYDVTYAAPSSGSGYVNTATVSGPLPDPDPTNNTTTHTITVADKEVDMAVTKTSQDLTSYGAYFVGNRIRYTIVARNLGPFTSETNTVVDTLPAGAVVTSNSINPSASVVTSNGGRTLTWDVGSLSSGYTRTLTYEIIYTTQGSYTNTAVITGLYPDPDLSNNTASVTDPIQPLNADIGVVKTVTGSSISSGNSYRSGDTFTYRINISNSGPSVATNVVVRDTLPARVDMRYPTQSSNFYVQNGAYTFNTGSKEIVWTIPSLNVGSSSYLQVTVRVLSTPAGPTISNTATATSDVLDLDLSNNTSTVTVPATGDGPDLSVTKTISSITKFNGASAYSDSEINPGDTINFLVTVENIGTAASGPFSLEDIFPGSSTFVKTTNGTSGSPLGWIRIGSTNYPWSYGGRGIVNTHPGLSDRTGGSSSRRTTFNVEMRVDAVGNYQNAVVANLAGDTDPSNNTGIAPYTVVPLAPDVAVTKRLSRWASSASFSGSNPTSPVNTQYLGGSTSITPAVGDYVEYELGFVNEGNYALTSIPLRDVFPAGVTPVAGQVAGGTISGGQVNWNWGASPLRYLDADTYGWGFGEVLYVWARLDTAGVKTNTFSVSFPGDVDPSNDVATLTHTVAPANSPVDFYIDKTVALPTYYPGYYVDYTIVVGQRAVNGALVEASNFSVQDTLPAGLTLVNVTLDKGYTNNSSPVRNSVLNWSPGGTSFSWTGSRALFSETTARINVRALISGSTVGTRVNTATVSTTNPDAVPADNTSSASIEVLPNALDLSVEKTGYFGGDPSLLDYAGNILQGSDYVYELKVTNESNLTASGFTLVDALPAGVTLLSVSCPYSNHTPVYSQSGQNVTFTYSGNLVGSALPNAGSTGGVEPYTITYRLLVRLDASGTLTNVATVSTPGTESDYSNNTSSWTVDVISTATPNDLSVTKSASLSQMKNLSNVIYTVTFTNTGPRTLENVSVVDIVPSPMDQVNISGYLTWTGASPSGTNLSRSGNTVTATIPVMYPNTSATFSYSARANAPTPVPRAGIAVTNTVNANTTSPESPTGNNSAQATVTIVPDTADLTILKTSPGTPPSPTSARIGWKIAPGEAYSYNIVVVRPSNSGFNDSTPTRVVVTDVIPSELRYVSASVSKNSYLSGVNFTTDYNVGSRTLTVTGNGPWNNYGQATITVNVVADGPGMTTATQVVNTANVDLYFGSTPEPGPDRVPGDNTSTTTDEVDRNVDLSVTKRANGDRILQGAYTSWTVTVTNNYRTTAMNVSVTDGLPSGYTNWTVSGSGGSISGGTFSALVPTLAPGASVSWTLYANAPSALGIYVNSVTVTTPGPQIEQTPGNNSASAQQEVVASGAGSALTFQSATRSASVTKYGRFAEYGYTGGSPNTDIDVFREKVTVNTDSYTSNSSDNSAYWERGYYPPVFGDYHFIETGSGSSSASRTYSFTSTTTDEYTRVNPSTGVTSWTFSAGSGYNTYPQTESSATSTYSYKSNYSGSSDKVNLAGRNFSSAFRNSSNSNHDGGGTNGTYSTTQTWSDTSVTWNSAGSDSDSTSGSSTYPSLYTSFSPSFGPITTTITPKTMGPGAPYTTKEVTWRGTRSTSTSNNTSNSTNSVRSYANRNDSEEQTWSNFYPTSELVGEVSSRMASESFGSMSGGSNAGFYGTVSQSGWSGSLTEAKVEITCPDLSKIPQGKTLKAMYTPTSARTVVKTNANRQATETVTETRVGTPTEAVRFVYSSGGGPSTKSFSLPGSSGYYSPSSLGTRTAGGFVTRVEYTSGAITWKIE